MKFLISFRDIDTGGILISNYVSTHEYPSGEGATLSHLIFDNISNLLKHENPHFFHHTISNIDVYKAAVDNQADVRYQDSELMIDLAYACRNHEFVSMFNCCACNGR